MTWTLPARGRFTSDYGPRVAPTPGASAFHRGIDIAPPVPGEHGVPVVAVGPGIVLADPPVVARGLSIVIRHDDGSATRYQHLAARDVTVGARVVAGQQIGVMGASGTAAGVHLHFECFTAGTDWTRSSKAVDPEPFMRARGVSLRAQTVTPAADTTTIPDVVDVTTPAPIAPLAQEADMDAGQTAALDQARNAAQAAAADTAEIRRMVGLLLGWGTPATAGEVAALDDAHASPREARRMLGVLFGWQEPQGPEAAALSKLYGGAPPTVDIDEAAIAAQIVAAIPAVVAQQVVDLLTQRLAT